ncbi:hypothetical protein AA18889_1781 [Acetobacter senegalensis DSM 18889]|nr:hypothetical protein AA18889_1781 [Acetobacter senegalensis DSM 18889]
MRVQAHCFRIHGHGPTKGHVVWKIVPVQCNGTFGWGRGHNPLLRVLLLYAVVFQTDTAGVMECPFLRVVYGAVMAAAHIYMRDRRR